MQAKNHAAYLASLHERLNIEGMLFPVVTVAMTICCFCIACTVSFATTEKVTPAEGMKSIIEKIQKCSPGDSVVFSPGTYHGQIKLSKVKGSPDKPIVIRGEPGAILNPSADPQAQDPKRGSTLQIENSANVVVEGFEIIGSDRCITIGNCDNARVQKCYIHDTGTGVMVYKCSNVLLLSNKIHNCYVEHGIYVSTSGSNNRIIGNVIDNTHVNGIHMNGNIHGSYVAHNVIHRTGYYPFKEGGAGVTVINGGQGARIVNNLFSDIHGQGVTIVKATDTTIAYNVFDHFTWSGVLAVEGSKGITVKGNIFIDPKTIVYNVADGPLNTLSVDNNYYVLHGQPVALVNNDKQAKYSFDEWRAHGQDRHSLATGWPFAQGEEAPGTDMKRFVLSTQSKAVDGGPEVEVDGALPPGQGAKRADMGLFGGPDNLWPQ